MDVRIETLAPIHVARIRHIGPYNEDGPCFERLFQWAAGLGVPTGRVFTLPWDDPERVPAVRLRCDACAELSKEEEPAGGVELGRR